MFLKNSGVKIMNTCVLIPSYNEAKTVGRIIKDLKCKNLEVCVIDDGSTDDTASIAGSNGAVVLSHEKNKGKGASLREGFKYALKEGFDAVLIMDGDGQHDVNDVDKFFVKMETENADIVIGNRMSNAASMPLDRKVTNKFMSHIISKICGHVVPDTQCGFKLIKKKVLEDVILESSNFEVESEIIIKAAKKGFRIESVPVKTIYNDETSKIKPLFDTIRFFAFLFRTVRR